MTTKNHSQQFRQGDVFIERIGGVEALPEGAQPIERDNGRVVLAYGEVTGHSHAIAERNADIFTKGGERWLVIRPGEPVERSVLVKVGYQPPCEIVEGPVREDGHEGLARVTVRTSGAILTHEEHGALILDPGTYRLLRQREYTPEAIRNVAD